MKNQINTPAMSQHQIWMNTIQEQVTISMSPSKEKINELHALINPSEDWDGFNKSYRNAFTEEVYTNISLKEAQTIAEPMRIANPDQCVSLYTNDKSFIGNTSWNDQMKMFWEYETYTPEGKALADARAKEAEALGLIASWE